MAGRPAEGIGPLDEAMALSEGPVNVLSPELLMTGGASARGPTGYCVQRMDPDRL